MEAKFRIESLWDGTKLEEHKRVEFSILFASDRIVITVKAPFFNDPKPHPSPSQGWHHLQHQPGHVTDGSGCLNFDGLWNFEVVELFIKGKQDKYLEIEMGPHGHFLILACQGYRQCFVRGIEPISYRAEIVDQEWQGVMEIPPQLLPPVTSIASSLFTYNAYAIHGKGESRIYACKFGPSKAEGDYANPDFHKLELFQRLPVDLSPEFLASHAEKEEQSVWESRPFLSLRE